MGDELIIKTTIVSAKPGRDEGDILLVLKADISKSTTLVQVLEDFGIQVDFPKCLVGKKLNLRAKK